MSLPVWPDEWHYHVVSGTAEVHPPSYHLLHDCLRWPLPACKPGSGCPWPLWLPAGYRNTRCRRFFRSWTPRIHSALPAYLRVPPYFLQASLRMKFSAFFAYPSSTSNFQNLLTFDPSANVHDHLPTMASADFWQFSRALLHGLPCRSSSPWPTCQTSPG